MSDTSSDSDTSSQCRRTRANYNRGYSKFVKANSVQDSVCKQPPFNRFGTYDPSHYQQTISYIADLLESVEVMDAALTSALKRIAVLETASQQAMNRVYAAEVVVHNTEDQVKSINQSVTDRLVDLKDRVRDLEGISKHVNTPQVMDRLYNFSLCIQSVDKRVKDLEDISKYTVKDA